MNIINKKILRAELFSILSRLSLKIISRNSTLISYKVQMFFQEIFTNNNMYSGEIRTNDAMAMFCSKTIYDLSNEKNKLISNI